MKNICKLVLIIVLILNLAGCNISQPIPSNKEEGYQKMIGKIERYESSIPKDYKWFDYRQKAIQFDNIVFDRELLGEYLPLIWEDKTYNSFGIPAYVGDKRMHKDGEQEAVTAISSVLSATHMGIDKTNQKGYNYVKELSAFYSENEKIVLNNPKGSSETTSMWYLVYPAILFTQVSILYPDEANIRQQALTTIESWYKAYEIMNSGNSFDYTGFNFITNQPYKNGIWTEPDGIAGISMLLYYGYEMTNEEKYLTAAINGLEYLTTYFGSPMYEALLYFAPYLASMFNARFDTNYYVEDIINDIFNGNSIPRGGWGSITGTWGNYNMNGLMGSITDGGGYAFAMNTFTAAYAMSPVAKYDTRFATSLGKWYLNLVGNSRYFFPDETEIENQSSNQNKQALEFIKTSEGVIPYEGIRKNLNSKSPWVGGDPTIYGWAETDFSLYSGAHIGLLASIIEATNIEAILKINLNKADLYSKDYPTSLIYNPYDKQKLVQYNIESNDIVDLYDTIKKEYIATNVSGVCDITINADKSVVVVELPASSQIQHEGTKYLVNDKLIGTDNMVLVIDNYKNNDEVTGTFQLKLNIISTLNDSVKDIVVTVDDKQYYFEDIDKVKFSSNEVGTGSKTFFIKVTTESNLTDEMQIRLTIK